jgi:hypothetical protein
VLASVVIIRFILGQAPCNTSPAKVYITPVSE